MIKSVSMQPFKRYEQFSHTADIGIRVFGRTLKELFENAAFAMFDIIADLEGLKGEIIQEIELTAPNHEELLVSWLDELLYNFYTKGVIFYNFDVKELSEDFIPPHQKSTLEDGDKRGGISLGRMETPGFIKAKAFGRLVSDNRNRLKTEIKAATYYNLKIIKKDDYYEVDIVFDV